MPDDFGTLPEESGGRPDAITNDIQSMTWYYSTILRYAQSRGEKNAKRFFGSHFGAGNDP
jgi:hypothetical protein